MRTPGPVSISIFAFGTSAARHDGAARRRQARRHRIFVTGTIGDASLGLTLLREPARKAAWNLSDADAKLLIDRYRVPRPRVALAEAVRTYASAAMDISDGLLGDLGKLCDASNVSARIEATGVAALGRGARQALRCEPALIEGIATGGDDYEILCAIAPEHAAGLSCGRQKRLACRLRISAR